MEGGICLSTTIPGVGNILSFTITLETGPVSRFAATGNYASDCRKVPTRWTSNGKSKGNGNKKNGNKYLAWAFSEPQNCRDASIRESEPGRIERHPGLTV